MTLLDMTDNVIKFEQFYDEAGNVKKADALAADVFDISKERLDRIPHKVGEVACICCGHTYTGVAPVGVHHLECTQCGQMMAFFIHPVEGNTGDLLWTCDKCGCQAFSQVIRNGNRYFWCCGCGVYIPPEDFLTD